MPFLPYFGNFSLVTMATINGNSKIQSTKCLYYFPYITCECLSKDLTIIPCKLWWESYFKFHTWWLPRQPGTACPKYANDDMLANIAVSCELCLQKCFYIYDYCIIKVLHNISNHTRLVEWQWPSTRNHMPGKLEVKAIKYTAEKSYIVPSKDKTWLWIISVMQPQSSVFNLKCLMGMVKCLIGHQYPQFMF